VKVDLLSAVQVLLLLGASLLSVIRPEIRRLEPTNSLSSAETRSN
jgi:hypothetical protein